MYYEILYSYEMFKYKCNKIKFYLLRFFFFPSYTHITVIILLQFVFFILIWLFKFIIRFNLILFLFNKNSHLFSFALYRYSFPSFEQLG